jgi:pyrimidine-nucleoside phosphorylase
MIYLGEKADSIEAGVALSKKQVENGEALASWKSIVAEQGGDVSVIDQPEKYPKARFELELQASTEGFITEMNSFEIGMASLELGAGRKTIEDEIDPTAGIQLLKKTGDKVQKGETILKVFTNKPHTMDMVSEQLYNAISIGSEPPAREKLVTHISDSKGTRAFELTHVELR